MGLILDSSVLIAAERQGQNSRQMLSAIARRAGETEIALSVVTLIELPTVRPAQTQPSAKRSASSLSRNYSRLCASIQSRYRSLFVSGRSTARTRLKACASHSLIC